MKKKLFILFLFNLSFSYAQILDRTIIKGQIIVPTGEDADGVSIFNTDSNEGTVSTQNGEFTIAVAVGDQLVFSALQYEKFKVIIDQGVIDTGELNVFISEAVNELPEVVVTPYDLSGNVRVDVNRINVMEPNLPELTATEIQNYEFEFEPDGITSPKNAVMNQQTMKHGLQFVNIFKALFSERNSKESNQKAIDEKVRSLYDDTFFQEYLNVDYEHINDFIFFAENNGLGARLLQDGKELDLIEFLIAQSEKYKAQQ